LKKPVEVVVAELKKLFYRSKIKKELAQVATIAANSDENYQVNLIAKQGTKSGKTELLPVEKASQPQHMETVEGMQFDQGYLSPYFVTDAERMETLWRILIF